MPLTVAALIAIILAAQGLTLWRSYQATWQLAVRSADNVLHTIASNIERNLSVIDLSLKGVEEAIASAGVTDLAPELRQMVLFDRAASAQFLGSMLVLDREGTILYDSGSPLPRPGNFSDRDYFRAQLNGGAGVYVSAPFESRLRGGDPTVAISRRLTSSGGTFAGVVIGALRVAYFHSLVDNVDLGPESVIAITRTDGTVLLRHPSTDGKGNAGVSVAASPVFQRMIKKPGEPFGDRSALDGVHRYYLHARIGDFPILLSVGISPEAALREWTEGALVSSALTIAMCVLLILMIRALRLALMRSQEVEGQLEVLAVTDQLTGLPNRRAFDLAMASETRRAARHRSSLAVLLIDVDHFKRVNDRYGHGVGDVVLARIAKQIGRSIRRPGDFAARYGGEEFVVILPATEVGGATFIAERTRLAIAAMVPCPTEPSLEKVTVSIGVAVTEMEPSPHAALVTQADRALYDAKGMGRNRVAIYQQDEPAAPPHAERPAGR